MGIIQSARQSLLLAFTSRRQAKRQQQRLGRLRAAVAPVTEMLEQRVMLTGSITGRIWNDINADGVRDAGENALSGWVVYLDHNRNHVRDAGEAFTLSKPSGRYTFTGLAAGRYHVHYEIREDWTPNASGTGGVRLKAKGDAEVRAKTLNLTYGGSKAPVYLADAESNALIDLPAFRSDQRFAGVDGQGYSVVIIDTGIDRDHPFFGPDNDHDGIADRIVFQRDYADGDDDASDPTFDPELEMVSGHGSNVASIAAGSAANYSGMAPAANIIALKVFRSTDAYADFGYIEQALQWVVANTNAFNVAAVNMSLGVGNWNEAQSFYPIGDELAALAARNVIVVSAAGNDYYTNGSAQGVAYPAADPNSLAVGAVWDANVGRAEWGSGAIDSTTAPDRIASFSQRSTTLLDIFAPGALITGANQNGGTVNMAGTSQASPHIAGIAVLAQQLAMQELGRRLTMAEFRDLLRATGEEITDGDDENDNVTNTNASYRRVQVDALADAIYDAPHSLGVHAVSTSQINLTWTDATSGESGFKVERSIDGGNNWSQIAALAANTTSYSATGLSANTTYYFRVRSYDAAGNSAYSNVASVSTLTNAPSNLTATSETNNRIRVRWTDTSNDEAGFSLERSDDGGVNWSLVTTLAANTTEYANTGLTAHSNYWYRLRAYDGSGQYSLYSNLAASHTPTAGPGPASSFTATGTSATQVDLSWTDTSSVEWGYLLERSTSGAANTWNLIADLPASPGTGGSVYYSDTSVEPGRAYYYRLSNYYTYASSVYVSANVGLMAAPSNLTATSETNNRIRINWQDNSTNESGFVIEHSTDGSAWSELATVGQNTTTYANPGIAANVSHRYRVRAYDSSNPKQYSFYSNLAASHTPTGGPGVPINLAGTAISSTQINLTWTDNSSVEWGYLLERSTSGAANTWTLIADLPANTTSYSDTGVQPGTHYYYRVSSYYDYAGTAYALVDLSTQAGPNAPSSLTASIQGGGSIGLFWTNVSGESGYYLERSDDGGATWSRIATLLADATSYQDSNGLVSGISYAYRICAYDFGGNSSNYSNIAEAVA